MDDDKKFLALGGFVFAALVVLRVSTLGGVLMLVGAAALILGLAAKKK